MLLNPDSLDPDKHEVGKQNTQKTERKNMTIALRASCLHAKCVLLKTRSNARYRLLTRSLWA